ncbi:MAG: hypothetical protein JSU57_02185 [Candidatus Heimdallarchaeota archaeon]|nr:MAG: hypothetical protein JSU57_02185 [Candidatus Heimdallarchaeota archaeon]
MTKNVRKKKSPGGRLLVHKAKRKTRNSHCRICGTVVQTNTLKDSKSGRHADRPYGGEICHACLRTTIQALDL